MTRFPLLPDESRVPLPDLQHACGGNGCARGDGALISLVWPRNVPDGAGNVAV